MEVRVPKDRINHLLSRLDTRQVAALEKGRVELAGLQEPQELPLDFSKVKELLEALRSLSAGNPAKSSMAGGVEARVDENGDVVFDHEALINVVLEIQKDLVTQAQGVASTMKGRR